MSRVTLNAPLIFEPICVPRIWGGRGLAEHFGKDLPPNESIGEIWEMVDRDEAQSVVAGGTLKGKTLHELWTNHRASVFGDVPTPPRFPLLIKLLDAREKLSVQVHPPTHIARALGAEPKTEFWYVATADPGAEIFVGFDQKISPAEFTEAVRAGSVADHLHRIPVKTGDAVALPSGSLHALGAGCVIVEIQQNSDTTYRVFDWDRVDRSGQPRELHLEQALASINFDQIRPELVRPEGELLVTNEFFEVQLWMLEDVREACAGARFAVICCLTGGVRCAGVVIRPGHFMLVPASLEDRRLESIIPETALLRVTLPSG